MSHLITCLIFNFFDINIVKLCDPNFIKKNLPNYYFFKKLQRLVQHPKLELNMFLGKIGIKIGIIPIYLFKTRTRGSS